MNIYHSQFKTSPQLWADDTVSAEARAVLIWYRNELEDIWPEIADKIEIGFARGSRGKTLCFSHRLSANHSGWISFFEERITHMRTLRHCKSIGMEEILISDGENVKRFTLLGSILTAEQNHLN